MRFRLVLPLPRFVLHPLTAVAVAVVHIYLAVGHLAELVAGQVEWTHLWKGVGALAGAYVFAALAGRRIANAATACAPNAVGEDAEETVHDSVSLFGT